MPSGTSATIREWLLEPSQACAGDCPVWYLPTARWSHGGRHLALLLPREEREGRGPPGVPLAPPAGPLPPPVTSLATGVLLLTPSGQTETTIEEWWLVHPRFLPDDSVMAFRELSFAGTCVSSRRRTSPLTLWRASVSVGVEECDPVGGGFFLPQMLAPPIPVAGGARTPRGAIEHLRKRPARVSAN